MRATVCTVRNPFQPARHRTVAQIGQRKRIRALAPKTTQPFICVLNGRAILRAEWRRRVADGDVVTFVVLPQGGGGGSNPLRMVLMIAVAVFAPYATTALVGLNGAAAIGSFGVSLVTAGIGLAGAALVNALIPPPKPPSAQTAGQLAAPSPTYSLQAQGNAARLDQPIPVIYGRHIVYPDFAAAPYVEYGGNEQYLYQLMVVGQGLYDIEAIRIEDTPISSFDEIEYQIVAPGESLTLFPANVVTSIEVSGQELVESEYLGPFVANAAGTQANIIGIDVATPRGLYFANDSGGLNQRTASFKAEARLIDDDGDPVGAWFDLGTESISGATTTPQRRSYRYNVSPGRYEVRATRTNTKETSTRGSNEIAWGGMRAYLPGTPDYGDVTLIAFRMRASNNLSQQASRRINVIVQRLLPVWHPDTGWSAPQPTRSPAWAFADIARAQYGARLPDGRIDLAGLYALSLVWEDRHDFCDIVFDSPGTIWEGLTTIARTGRAHPYLQGGVLHCYRDGPATVPVGMFTPRNMLRGSFKVTYKMPNEEQADAVDVEYFDATVWRFKTVRCALPDSTTEQPVKVKLIGVCERAQAWREGMYMAACNRYRRRFVGFGTEMEGFIPSPGDLLTVTHDMPSWGQFAEAVDFDPATRRLRLTEPPEFDAASAAHYLAWRGRDGRPRGPWQALPTEDPHVVELADWDELEDPEPDTDSRRERSHVAFGPAEARAIRCRAIAIRPRSMETADLDLVVESDAVHTADTGAVPGASGWQLPAVETAPRVLGLSARSMPDDVNQIVLSWAPTPGANLYLVEQSADQQNWSRVGDTTANAYSGLALYGPATWLRVAAVGMTRGPWVAVAYGQSADYMWSADPATLMWAADDTELMWRA